MSLADQARFTAIEENAEALRALIEETKSEIALAKTAIGEVRDLIKRMQEDVDQVREKGGFLTTPLDIPARPQILRDMGLGHEPGEDAA